MFITCVCQNCPGHIEFEAEGVGLTVVCPHCGMETQLYIPQTKLELIIETQTEPFQTLAKNTLHSQSFSKKRARFYLGFIILAFIGFAAYKFSVWRADRLEKQNEIAATAEKNAEAVSEKAAEQAKLDDYLFIHRYSNAAHGSEASRSFEESQIDKYGSRLACKYTISYNNLVCLSISRLVTVYDGDQISTDMSDDDDLNDESYVYKDYYEDEAKGRTDMQVNNGTKSGRTVNILELQKKF